MRGGDTKERNRKYTRENIGTEKERQFATGAQERERRDQQRGGKASERARWREEGERKRERRQ